jgi:hypothetical protein
MMTEMVHKSPNDDDVNALRKMFMEKYEAEGAIGRGIDFISV